MSETIVGIFVGLLATLITNITSICIANRNRKVQHDMAIKEMELKEKIEYHKLAIDHTIMTMNHLIKWNINYDKILPLKIKNILAVQDKNQEKVNQLCEETHKLAEEMSNNIINLFVFISNDSRDKIEELQKIQHQKLSIEGSINDNFWKSSVQLETLTEINTIVLSEITFLKEKIDKVVGKYID